MDRRFDQFWAAYPKRVKKLDALKAWGCLNPSPQLVAQMLEALAWQVRSEAWTKEAGQFIPYPATWLRAGQWMDEPEIAQPPRLSYECPHTPPCASRWACGRKQQAERIA